MSILLRQKQCTILQKDRNMKGGPIQRLAKNLITAKNSDKLNIPPILAAALRNGMLHNNSEF